MFKPITLRRHSEKADVPERKLANLENGIMLHNENYCLVLLNRMTSYNAMKLLHRSTKYHNDDITLKIFLLCMLE
jgi:hypothetical protein